MTGEGKAEATSAGIVCWLTGGGATNMRTAIDCSPGLNCCCWIPGDVRSKVP